MGVLVLSRCFFQNPIKTLNDFSLLPTFHVTCFTPPPSSIRLICHQNTSFSIRSNRLRPSTATATTSPSTAPVNTNNYEFSDNGSEVELRLQLKDINIQSSKCSISVKADEYSLTVRVDISGSLITLMETDHLYDRIKPGETIWCIDDDHLVLSLKKQDPDLKWPDIVESLESLAAGAAQLLKGTSIYLVGDSDEINEGVARELAVGLGYTPLITRELLENFTKNTIDSWVAAEGPNSVADAESAVLESLSSHVRTIVATLGGSHGASGRTDKWRYLYAGFTVWLSQSLAKDEKSAKEEVRRHIQDGASAYANADVVVKLGGWDLDHAKTVAQASLSALKQLIMSDKKLPGKKSLYIRMGCRGDWPNIKPPGWNPSGSEAASASQ